MRTSTKLFLREGPWLSETSKCRARLAPYCAGCGLDIGTGGDPIVPAAVRVDLPQPTVLLGMHPVQLAGDAAALAWFRDETLDYVYASHTLEEFQDTESVLREWLRVLKPRGRLILYSRDEQVYRGHCQRQRQAVRAHRVHPNFSLGHVKRFLGRIGTVKILREEPLVDVYSWELVAEKLGLAGEDTGDPM